MGAGEQASARAWMLTGNRSGGGCGSRTVSYTVHPFLAIAPMVRRSVLVLGVPTAMPERVWIQIDGMQHTVHPFLAIAPMVRRSAQVLGVPNFHA